MPCPLLKSAPGRNTGCMVPAQDPLRYGCDRVLAWSGRAAPGWQRKGVGAMVVEKAVNGMDHGCGNPFGGGWVR